MEILEKVFNDYKEKHSLDKQQRDELEINRLNRQINRLTVLRLTESETAKTFYDKLITLNLNRKMEIQDRIGERTKNALKITTNPSMKNLKPTTIGEAVKMIENSQKEQTFNKLEKGDEFYSEV